MRLIKKIKVKYKDNILNAVFEDFFTEKQLENLRIFEKRGHITILEQTDVELWK